MVRLAREPEPGLVLARKPLGGALNLGRDRMTADLRGGIDELDVAVDAEVAPGVVPHVSGVGHGLVHEGLGAEPGTLLRAPLGHDQAPQRASCGAAPLAAAFTSWSFRSTLAGRNTLE